METTYTGNGIRHRLITDSLLAAIAISGTLYGSYSRNEAFVIDSAYLVGMLGGYIFYSLIQIAPKGFYDIELSGSRITGPKLYGIGKKRLTIDLNRPFRLKRAWIGLPYRDYSVVQEKRSISLSRTYLSKEDFDRIVTWIERHSPLV